MKLKHIVAVCMGWCMALIACRTNPNQYFQVTGTIRNTAAKVVYLQYLPYGQPNPIVTDSCTITANGQFNLKTIANDEAIFRLVFNDGREVLLINDAPTVSVTIDGNHFKKYTTIGSGASNALHVFLENYEKDYPDLLKVLKTNDSLRQQQALSDSLLTVIKLSEETELQKVNNLITNNLSRTNSPAFSYYLLIKAMATFENDEVYRMMQAAEKKFPTHQGIHFLNKTVAQSLPRYEFLNKQAPKLSLQDTAGIYYGLDSLPNQYVLVQFWASWNENSRNQNKYYNQIYQRFKPKSLEVIGVSLDSNKTAWKNAIEADGLHWKHISDLRYWNSKVVGSFQVKNIPFNILVNPQGKVIAFDLTPEKLEKLLGKLIP